MGVSCGIDDQIYWCVMERPTKTPSLAELLADRDTPCEHCGYNLRGCQDLFCPECGVVIPKPFTEPPQQALRCMACGYELGLAPLECCPECGSDAIMLGRGDQKQPLRNFSLGSISIPRPKARLWKDVPILVWESAAFGVLLTGIIAARTAWPVSVGRVLLLLCMTTPILVAAVWFGMRKTINSLPQRTRTRLVVVILLGTWTMVLSSLVAWS